MNQSGLAFKVERVYKLSSDGPIKAFIDMSINDCLVIKGLRIIQGKQGLFVTMPQEQGKDKKWYDSIRCIKQSVREEMFDAAMSAFQSQN